MNTLHLDAHFHILLSRIFIFKTIAIRCHASCIQNYYENKIHKVLKNYLPPVILSNNFGKSSTKLYSKHPKSIITVSLLTIINL